MNRKNQILLAVLLLQVVLVFITWFVAFAGPDAPTPDKALLSFKANDITRIRIEGMNGEEISAPVLLTRTDKTWQLESAGGFPVEKDKIDGLITALLDIKVGEPIASNPANHMSLNVAEKAFDRKIEITAGKETRVLFIGRGGRASGNVRVNGSNDVLPAKGLSVWAISSAPNGYINTEYAKIETADVTRFTVTNAKGTLDFTRAGEEWIVPALPEGKVVDKQKVDGLLNRLAGINMTVPIGKTDKPEYGLATGAKVSITGQKSGTPIQIAYTVGARDKETFFVKRDDNPFIVAVSTYNVEQTVDKALDDFLKAPPAAPDTDEAAADGGIDPAMLEQLRAMNPQMMGGMP